MLAARPRALPTYLHINPMRNLRIFTDEDLVTFFKLHNSPDSNSCSCFSVLIYSLISDCLGLKARIIGARALQISYGAPVLVDYPADMLDPIDIAMLEFDKDMVPITVIRE